MVEELGFDSVWVGDHVAWPLPILDPFLQLAQLAVLTERPLLGTAVLLLPLRHPTLVAKQVATLDRLSGGRLVLGVGVGADSGSKAFRSNQQIEEIPQQGSGEARRKCVLVKSSTPRLRRQSCWA